MRADGDYSGQAIMWGLNPESESYFSEGYGAPQVHSLGVSRVELVRWCSCVV